MRWVTPNRHWLPNSTNSPIHCATCCFASPTHHTPMRLTVQGTTRIQRSPVQSICPHRFPTTSACPTGRQRRPWAFSTMSAQSRSVAQCLRCNVEQERRWLEHFVNLLSTATPMHSKKSVHHLSSPQQRSPQQVSCRSLPMMHTQLSATICGAFQPPNPH